MNEYKICNRCVMDTTDSSIVFNENGCNHCNSAINLLNKINNDINRQIKLEKKINEIKEYGHGKKYDCLIGISGGVDSSYVAFLVKKFGLRPLAVHIDNGWNTKYQSKI